jgi:hypothetical protein
MPPCSPTSQKDDHPALAGQGEHRPQVGFGLCARDLAQEVVAAGHEQQEPGLVGLERARQPAQRLVGIARQA